MRAKARLAIRWGLLAPNTSLPRLPQPINA